MEGQNILSFDPHLALSPAVWRLTLVYDHYTNSASKGWLIQPRLFMETNCLSVCTVEIYRTGLSPWWSKCDLSCHFPVISRQLQLHILDLSCSIYHGGFTLWSMDLRLLRCIRTVCWKMASKMSGQARVHSGYTFDVKECQDFNLRQAQGPGK